MSVPENAANLVEHFVVIPPDGGWGWVIVATSFLIYVIIDGITYTFGIFLTEIGNSFDVHPTKVAVATSLMSGFYYLFGPISCALTNILGFRIVGVIGCFAGAGVFLGASYTNNLEVFLFITGFLGGISFNLIYTSCLLIVGFYFERWRALTTAISVTGTSVGIMVFPPLMNNVMEKFHWREKFRILSGICAGSSLLVLTFRPLEPRRVIEKLPTGERSSYSRNANFDDTDTIGSFSIEDGTSLWENIQSFFKNIRNVFLPTIMPPEDDQDAESRSTYYLEMPESDAYSAYNRRDFSVVSTGTKITVDFVKPDYNEEEKPCKKKFLRICTSSCNRVEQVKGPSRPMYRDDILFPGSIYTLPEYTKAKSESIIIVGSSVRMSSLGYHLQVTRTIQSARVPEVQQTVCPELTHVLATMFNFKLMKSPSFVLLISSGFATMIGLYSPFVFMIERGQEIGLDDDWCTLLLTAVGISNTIGRIVCGTLSCCPSLNLIIVSYVTLIIAGGATMASCFMNHLQGQLTFCIVFGFCIATFTALRSVILANMVGLENLTNAFGINILLYGIGSFIGIPLAGFIQNQTGYYGYAFLFAGVTFLLSGILLVPLEKVMKIEKRKKRRVAFQE